MAIGRAPTALRRAAAGAAAAAALLLAGWTIRVASPGLFSDEERERSGPGNYAAYGELLLHALPSPQVSGHGPASSALAALLFEHVPARAAGPARAAVVALSVGLVFAVCGTLGAAWGGPLAVALLLAHPLVLYDGPLFVHFFMSLWLLLVAGLSAWRARAPGPRRDVALAAAVGASLLFRSVLVLFPLVLAARELLQDRGRPARRRLSHALVLGVVPYLFLLPWARMNWTVHRELVLFERGESVMAVIMGALGFIDQYSIGDRPSGLVFQEALDRIGSQRFSAVLPWAVREVLTHPVRSVSAWAIRARLIAGQYPLILLAAASALFACRRSKAFQAAALVPAYMFAVHCLLPYCEEFYTPLWVLLLTLGSAAAARAASGRAEEPVQDSGPAPWLLHGALAGAVALAAFASLKAEAFARAWPGSMDEALARAADENPDEPVLLAGAGQADLRQGSFETAERRLSRAVELRPKRFDWKLRLAWARMLLRGEEPPALSEASVFGDVIDLGLLRGQWRSRAGRADEARRELAAAIWKAGEGERALCAMGGANPGCHAIAVRNEFSHWREFLDRATRVPGGPDARLEAALRRAVEDRARILERTAAKDDVLRAEIRRAKLAALR